MAWREGSFRQKPWLDCKTTLSNQSACLVGYLPTDEKSLVESFRNYTVIGERLDSEIKLLQFQVKAGGSGRDQLFPKGT